MKNFSDVFYMQDAEDFLISLDEKTREKILYNVSKAQYVRDAELFKKIDEEIWEFRTLYRKTCYRMLAFWDDDKDTIIICTHAFIKKTQKTPQQEIFRAKQLREEYFKNKTR